VLPSSSQTDRGTLRTYLNSQPVWLAVHNSFDHFATRRPRKPSQRLTLRISALCAGRIWVRPKQVFLRHGDHNFTPCRIRITLRTSACISPNDQRNRSKRIRFCAKAGQGNSQQCLRGAMEPLDERRENLTHMMHIRHLRRSEVDFMEMANVHVNCRWPITCRLSRSK
jgi:hypothetical protein